MRTRPRRFRPRFSIRTLAILITIVCCYAACWGPTSNSGVEDVRRYAADQYRRDPHQRIDPGRILWVSRSIPLIVQVDAGSPVDGFARGHRRYYFWFFGYVTKLPYEREVKH